MQERESKQISRRLFMKSTAAAMGAFTIVPSRVLGGPGHTPPSDTVYVAAIGVGGRGSSDIHSADNAGAKIVALCDVDEQRAVGAYKKYPEAHKYKDFRKLLDKEKNIDAVIVATPDHTHAVATMTAMERGKHVFCEKPLAHSLYETRKITEAARKYKVATQLGNQGRSSEHIRLFCEWIWDGAIGQVHQVHAMCRKSKFYSDRVSKIDETHKVPETFDWDLWLGPMPYRKYNPMYLPKTWRGWRQFGDGIIGDWACHIIDPVFWALDLGAPKTILAEVENYDPKKYFETFPGKPKITYEFPAKAGRGPVEVIWYGGGLKPPRPKDLEEGRAFPSEKNIGALVVGEKGKIMYGSHGADSCRIIPESKMKEYKLPPKTIPRSPGHIEEWLTACKGGHPAGSNFDYGGPLTEIALLGALATIMPGTKLEWDADTLTFPNCPEADQYINWQYRKGWSL